MGCCCSYILYYELRNKEDFPQSFTFDGTNTLAKVVDIYDGDTCTIVFKFNGQFIKHKTRAYGYDTHEMRPSKQLANRDIEIENAHRQKEAFKQLVFYNDDGIVNVELKGFDKYGRILAIYYGKDKTKSLNEIMVSEHGAKSYFGGTKI